MILDTNALSAGADSEKAVLEILAGAGQPALPVIVIGEFRYGISRSRRRDAYERWLDETIGSFTVLNIDQETTRSYTAIRLELEQMGRPIPSNDLWIAALSRQYSQPVLSRDRHFDLVKGLTRIGW